MLPQFLRAGDLLIFNNTRVLPARLFGWREKTESTGEAGQLPVELLLHRCRGDITDWSAFAKPARKLKAGHVLHFPVAGVTATVTGRADEEVLLRFELPAGLTMGAFLEAAGELPLPPYIERKEGITEADKTRYQTVYAQCDGSVAAPTAGLHFTPELLATLQAQGVELAEVTLHVGAGTFQPVRVDNLDEHKMHSEWGSVSPAVVEAVNATKSRGGRVICVGTTSMRLMESAARNGVLAPFEGDTDIFIRPGYQFNVADGLITNFHLPKSTLLMLVAAFVGYPEMRQLYAEAIEAQYRFYSYGDSSLLWRKNA